MREFFTARTATEQGLTRSARRWGERTGRWTRASRGVFADGPAKPTELEQAIGAALARGGVVSGRVAAVLHGFDAVTLDGPDFTVPPSTSGRRPGARRRELVGDVVEIDGVPCVDGTQTLADLAADLDELQWEQALESALRKRLTSVPEVEERVALMGRSRTPGAALARRVLTRRPAGAPATESLLETLMVQLARTVDGLPEPTRQYAVYDSDGAFAGRVDLCFPEHEMFVELDGQQHKDQPVYDARRETAVVAATGWLPGRFTWREVVHLPRTTARRLAAIAKQALNRSPR